MSSIENSTVPFADNMMKQDFGYVRHFILPNGTGWSTEDPNIMSKRRRRRIKIEEATIEDVSYSAGIVIEDMLGQKHTYPPGQFSLTLKGPGWHVGFRFAHPDDIKEFLQKAGVTQPGESRGMKITTYSVDRSIIGMNLPESQAKG